MTNWLRPNPSSGGVQGRGDHRGHDPQARQDGCDRRREGLRDAVEEAYRSAPASREETLEPIRTPRRRRLAVEAAARRGAAALRPPGDGGGRARRRRACARRRACGRRGRRRGGDRRTRHGATALYPPDALKTTDLRSWRRGACLRGADGVDRHRRRAPRLGPADRLRAGGGRAYLHLAAVASLTDVAIEDAKDEVEQNLRGSFLEDLRRGADDDDVVRRAGRLGCDLSNWSVLCAELTTDRPRHVVATIASELPGALAHGRGASTPCSRARATPRGWPPAYSVTGSSAPRRTTRIRRTSPAPCRRPSSCSASLRESGGDGGLAGEDIGSGTYRLLFRVLASHPEEVQAFYEDTVGSVVRYDGQYGTDLVATLEAYLDHDCNMNATRCGDLRPPPPSPTASSACATSAAGPFALPGPRAPRPRPEGLPDHAPPRCRAEHPRFAPLHQVEHQGGQGGHGDAGRRGAEDPRPSRVDVGGPPGGRIGASTTTRRRP